MKYVNHHMYLVLIVHTLKHSLLAWSWHVDIIDIDAGWKLCCVGSKLTLTRLHFFCVLNSAFQSLSSCDVQFFFFSGFRNELYTKSKRKSKFQQHLFVLQIFAKVDV